MHVHSSVNFRGAQGPPPVAGRRFEPRPRCGGCRGIVVAALLLASAGVPTAGGAQEFQVDLNSERLVRFISNAPIEDFDGTTERIDGFVLLDAPDLAGAEGGEDTAFYFEVELASLDTGIGLRNRHMRNDYLEVQEFPYATFEGHVAEVRPVGTGLYALEARGVFGVHGVRRDLEVSCMGSPQEVGFRISCEFQVLLSDYDIDIPQVMFLKLADEIRLELDFAVVGAGGP